ncbi:MAG: DNA repair protein RecO [Firmicutes bacterium]|nr:DNA repair protein RecO [Bacillota bacterium]
MKFFRVEAVVLKAKEHKEADRILTLYSLERGKIRAISHGSARPKSRKRGAVQPFCRSRFFLTREREFNRVDQVEVLERFPQVGEDIRVFGYASYFAELLDGFTVEEVPNRPLYYLLIESLRALGGDGEWLSRAFEIRLLVLTGFGPELNCCVSCRKPLQLTGLLAFVPEAGGAVCSVCSRGYPAVLRLSPGALQMVRRLAEGSLTRVFTLKPDPVTRQELKKIMSETIALHLGYRPRSLDFIESVNKS